MRNSLFLVAATLVVAGCKDDGVTPVAERNGAVAGVAYVDRNANGVFDQTDGLAAGAIAAVILEATGDTVRTAVTRVDGTFLIDRIPIGQYRVAARRGELGDTLEVADIPNASVSVAAGDTAVRMIPFGYPAATTAAVRTLPAGRRVVVRGLALNGWAAFADSTVHVQDPTGALRTVRVQGGVAAGDSVRLIGVVASRDGQAVLTAVTAFTVASLGLPEPDSVSTATAAGAAGGTRDAGQVRVGGPITGTQTLPGGDVLLTVDDGSGALDVLMDKDVTFNAGPYQTGALLRASGVLVPAGTGTWRLKPRTRDDAQASYPSVTIAAARSLQVGQTVQLTGSALNSRNTFGDATVHLADNTAAIRITAVPPSPAILAGYTIRIVGSIAIVNTQPVLVASSITQVTVGSLAAPDSVSTQTAASADGGTRDAAQVAVSGTISAITGNAAGDVVLTVNDGSGPLAVVLDRDVFQANPYSVADQIRVRGVLVPVANGTAWELKPRTLNEVALQ